MGSAVKMRMDYSAVALRRLAKAAKDVTRAGACCRWLGSWTG